MQRILFLLAHYRNSDTLEGFVRHLLSLSSGGLTVHFAVADNSGDLDSARLDQSVSVYRSHRNLGYLPGCARALDHWLDEFRSMPQWVVVANSDMTLQQDFLEQLGALRAPDDVGIIAPDIFLPSGARQNPLLSRRPLKLLMGAYAMLARSSLFSSAFELWVWARHRIRALRPKPAIPAPRIYAPHGSLVLFHRRFFEKGGTLRYGAPMYGEEIHLAEQARRASLRVVWCRELVADHFEHSTTVLVTATQRAEWRAQSATHLWNEYFRDGVAA